MGMDIVVFVCFVCLQCHSQVGFTEMFVVLTYCECIVYSFKTKIKNKKV